MDNVAKVADVVEFTSKYYPDAVKLLSKNDDFVSAAKAMSKNTLLKMTKADAERINKILDDAGLSEYAIKSGSKIIDYKKVFFEKHPELEGKVIVHHSVEQQVLRRYPNLFTKEELNAYEMLRGIPKEANSNVHLSKIRIEWNEFYKKVDAGEITLTKENFLNKAKEIDEMFGDKFNPPK